MNGKKILIGLLGASLGGAVLGGCASSAKRFTVKFTNGNELVESKEYKENEVIIAPKDPDSYEKDKKSYTFDAWYDGDTKFIDGTKATKDVEYVAKFNSTDIQYYTVTFMNGDEEFSKKTDARLNEVIVAPENVPTKEGDAKYKFTFNTWYYKDTETEFKTGDKVKGNTVLVADYNISPVTYTVRFDGLSTVIDNVREISIDNLSIVTPEFTPQKHYTGEWYSDYAGGVKKAGSGETITFTEEELRDWGFNYSQKVIQYLISFEKNGEIVKNYTKNIRDINSEFGDPSFTAPEFTPTESYTGEWFCSTWGEEGKSLGSGEVCNDLTVDNLNHYTFIYRETQI